MKFILLLEYLLYLSVFILMFKLSESALVNRSQEENNEVVRGIANEPVSKNMPFRFCEEGMSWMCLKGEFLQYFERLAENDEIKLLPGLVIVKDTEVAESKPAEIMAELARSYPNDHTSRLTGYIVSKLTHYMQSHFIRMNLFDDTTASEVRALSETGRSKPGKKGGGFEALIAAAMVMKGTLMALAVGALALLAGKALMTALMALMLSGIVGLKSMGGGKETKNVIIAKHHTHHDDGHEHSAYAGYARNIQLDQLTR